MKQKHANGIFMPITILCLLCSFFTAGIKAQAPDLKYEIRYAQKTETYFVRADPDWQPTQIETTSLLPFVVKDSIVKTVLTDNSMRTTRFLLNDSRVPDWMSMPYRTVYTMDKVKSYNADGSLIHSFNNSDIVLSTYEKIRDTLTATGADLIPEFPFMTSKRKNELLFEGYSVTKLPGGFFRCVKDSVQLLFNNMNKTFEVLVFDEDSLVKYYNKKGFHISPEGQLVPLYEVSRVPDERFVDNEVFKIDVTNYTSYRIIEGVGFRLNAKELNRFSLYPNPAVNELVIAWDDFLSQPVTVEVFDINGTSVLYSTLEGVDAYTLDVSSLTPGMYFIRVTSGESTQQKQFVKL